MRLSDQKVLEYRDVILRECDVATLDAGSWLNDAMLDFCLKYLEDTTRTDGPRSTECVPPSTCFLMLHGSVDVAASIAESLHLEAWNTIVFSLNNAASLDTPLSGSHWSCLVVTKSDGGTRHIHYDSMGGINDDVAVRMSRRLGEIMPSLCAKLELNATFTRRQENAYDCGMFVLAVAEAYLDSQGDCGMTPSVRGKALETRIRSIGSETAMELRQRMSSAVSQLRRS
jgi:sentrin-specific protease 8